MRNSFLFFPKLAIDNMKKNSKIYLPYLLTGIISGTIYYILRSISLNPEFRDSFGGGAIHGMLQMGADVSAFFIILFLFYTNGFLMKQRKKEFAIFHILGMDKGHIARTLAIEALYTFFISVFGGIILGIALDKLNFLILAKLVHVDATLGFFLAPSAIVHVIVLFMIAYFLIFLKSVWSLYRLNPAELLQESKAGEKEPKVKWFWSIAGVLILGMGYVIALRAEHPLMAIPSFFIASVLVIVGTFLLFTTGSITFLNILRKNKKFYYKTNHFISVSGLIYRMKQNALGLASICILSTMVLVMISSTGSLMVGIEDMIKERYPNDFNFSISETKPEKQQQFLEQLHNLQKEQAVTVTDEIQYRYLGFPVAQKEAGFEADDNYLEQSVLFLIPLSDYNKATGDEKTLHNRELLLHTKRMEWNHPSIKILGEEFSIKEHIRQFPQNGFASSNVLDMLFLVCSDTDFEFLNKLQKEAYPSYGYQPSCYYEFDTSSSMEKQNKFRLLLYSFMEEYDFAFENQEFERKSVYGLFGGMFFIGVYLGLLFTIATVLIIYYKQISEGYEDRERFLILQKVGMSQEEVKKAIHSQVLIVFFLPLLFAAMHIAVAFPILKKLLLALGFIQASHFATIIVMSFLMFSLLYIMVYGITAKTYYKIVRR